MKTKPMTMLLAMLAGWMNQQQQQIIEYQFHVCTYTLVFQNNSSLY